jgi:two-component system, cell cycle response regulator DivK
MAARMLLVEDNPTNLALVQSLLQAAGYATLAATDGLQGVVVPSRDSPDVILMDCRCPSWTAKKRLVR